MNRDGEYLKSILNMGRLADKPRKDITKWSEVKSLYAYFFDDLFDSQNESVHDLPITVPASIAKQLVHAFSEAYNPNDDRVQWFEKVKDIAELFGYASDTKLFKKNPEIYKGHVGDVAAVLRIALTKRVNTPDLYDIVQIMQVKRVHERLAAALDSFNA